MRHDERTIRNVDDELYRIAPRTHSHGRERINAREEYARDLKEKDYLRAQMNRLANGGQPMPMPMAAPPMPMGAAPPMPMGPPPEAQVQMTENAAAQQGEMLGEEYLDGMMTGIDTADSTEELIDAIRGNDKTLQDRYDELANFVGERDASATPESVLTLVQPTIMMTEQGAMDSGVGELMQGIAGEVEMETEMGAPTPMGQGVGELMMTESVEEVIPQMNAGGPVQCFNPGGEVSPRQQNLTQKMLGYEQLYGDALGYGEEDEQLAKLAIYSDIANRGLALAGGVNPNTGERMSGNLVSQVSQAAQGLPQTFVQAGAQKRAADRSLRQAALGQAISEQTAMDQARYSESLRRSGLAPAMFDVVDKEGTKVTLDLNDRTDEATFRTMNEEGKVASVNRVSAITQPSQAQFKNLVIAGKLIGTVNTSRGENVDAQVKQLYEAAGISSETPYVLEDLETTGLTYTPEETALQEAAAKDILGAIESGKAARTINNLLDFSQELTLEGNFKQGAYSDVRRWAGEVNNLLGNPINNQFIAGPDAAAAFSAVSSQLLAETVSQLEGLRGTNLVLRTLRESGPELSNSAEGNLLIINIRKALNDHEIGKADIAQDYRDAGGSQALIGGKNYFTAIQEFERDNPIVSPELTQQIQNVSGNMDPANSLEALANAEAAFEAATDQYDTFEDYLTNSGMDMWEQIRVRGAQAYRDTMYADRDAILRGSTVRGARN